MCKELPRTSCASALELVINLSHPSPDGAARRPYHAASDDFHLDRQNMIDHVGAAIGVALEGLDATA